MSPAAWNLSAPVGPGVEVRISHVNNRNLCDGGGCPATAEIAAGKGRVQVLCYLVMGKDVPVLQGSALYQGSFLAGHVYGITPQSVVPDCRIKVEDQTSSFR